MALDLNDLCRLCAKKDDFSKDLLDENNKHLLKLIQDFIQIIIHENDNLPTKICLSCEEKMVSFQLFVLECFEIQETLRKIYSENDVLPSIIKVESNTVDFPSVTPVIKSEVKDEITSEEIASALKNESSLTTLEIYNDDEEASYDTYDNDNQDNDDDYLSDDISIATLQKRKQTKDVKKKVLTEQDSQKFVKLLKKTNLKAKDFVKLECTICGNVMKTWTALSFHYSKVHKSKPVVHCLCGFVIRSKSVLYTHVTNHKVESLKLRKENGKNGDNKYDRLNVKDFVTFTCSDCKKVCSSWYTLKSHCERKHGIAPLVHCTCGITLKSKSVMYKHVQDHKSPNILACDKCPRITKSISALNKHKMRHVPKSERKFCCSSCEKIFNTKEALKSHERSHIPIEERKIYHCDICNLKFTTRSSAASHKRVVHEKIKGFVCDLCGYACGTSGELRQHRAIHSDDKPFVCRKCPKSFKTYSNLKTHMDTHEDTSYECYICRRVLNSRRTLRKHLLVHEDKCRHVCSYCNKAFKRRQTLKVHMYTHTGDKPLTCKWCEERFAYASTLRSHRLRCHPDKMSAHSTNNYNYTHATMHQNYVKSDVIASNGSAANLNPVNLNAAKNEVEIL